MIKDIIQVRNKHIETIFAKESAAFVKILHWFFDYPDKEMSLSDLSSILNISKANANKVVSRLVKEGFLNKEVIGKVWRISCNQQHIYNNIIKIPYHLELVYLSNVFQNILKEIPSAKAVVLFGSYRKGDDNEKSDIDIAVEILGSEETKIKVLTILERIGYRKNVKVNSYIFTRNKVDLNLFNNIANGIVLSGFLEVRP